MGQELCKLKQQLLMRDFAQYAGLVSNPQFVCTNCGRAANAARNLCQPCPIVQSAPAAGGRSSLIQEILIRRQPA